MFLIGILNKNEIKYAGNRINLSTLVEKKIYMARFVWYSI